MKKKDKYIQGLNMEQFEHLPQISCYNNNYYVGFDGDLLFEKSYDSTTSAEWYLVNNKEFYYLGEAYFGNETLHTCETENISI